MIGKLTLSLWIIFCTLIGIFSYWPMRRFSPLMPFAAVAAYFALSTVVLLNFEVEADRSHGFLIALFFLGFLVHSQLFFNHTLARKRAKAWSSKPIAPVDFEPAKMIVVMLFLSFAISAVYYLFPVGYNLFLPTLRGEDLDFVTLRLEAYSGSRYTGAGLVNQFKNTLLPITFYALIAWLWRRRKQKIAISLAMAFMPFFLWVLLGTGQRTFLFFALIGLFIYLNLRGQLHAKYVAWSLALFIPLFAAQSLSLGRTENFSDVWHQFYRRLSGANQWGTVVGYSYVYQQPVQFGKEWLQQLLGLVPGLSGSDLSNRIHALMFGSMRGTVPVSLWVSIYHNFGMVSVPIVTTFLLKLIEGLDRIILGIPRTELSMSVWAFLILYVAVMPLTSPIQIFNNGVLALILVIVLLHIHFGKQRRRTIEARRGGLATAVQPTSDCATGREIRR